MKKAKRIMKPVFGLLAVLFTITILSMPVFAAEPDNPNYWTVEDELCEIEIANGGDTVYYQGVVRHCLSPDVEVCMPTACQVSPY